MYTLFLRKVVLLSLMSIFSVGYVPEVYGVQLQKKEYTQLHSKIDEAMNSYIGGENLAGIATMVMKDGEVIQQNCYGRGSLDSNQELKKDAIFRIYSMTKPITSVAIMKLYEAGKFKLDDEVSKYIPEFKELKVFENGTSVPANSQMTIRNLFTHTSGFTYGWDREAHVDSLYRVHKISGGDENLAAKVKILSTIPLKSHPGTKWEYSISIDVLGYLIEVLSGQSFDVYLKENLFDPLGMKDTGFYTPEEKLNRLTTVYGPKEGTLQAIDSPESSRFSKPPVLFSGGGGLVSTIDDYSRFCQMILNKGAFNGQRVLKESTIEMIQKNQMPDGREAWEGVGFGLGFAVAMRDDPLLPKGAIWWSGAADTHFWIDPKNNMFMLIFGQRMPHNKIPFPNDFKKITYEFMGIEN